MCLNFYYRTTRNKLAPLGLSQSVEKMNRSHELTKTNKKACIAMGRAVKAEPIGHSSDRDAAAQEWEPVDTDSRAEGPVSNN